MASDAGNQSPQQVCKKEGCEKLDRHAFHVINVTLLRSRGTSSANTLSSGSSRVSIPRFARFREDSTLGSCINFQRKTTTNEQFPRCTCCIRVFYHNITQLCRRMTPAYSCSTLNETLFERKCLQARFLVFQTKTRRRRTSQGVVDTTTVHHQSSRNLPRFRLPVSQIQLSEQNFFQAQTYVDSFVIAVCRCLGSLLQMKILPPVSIDSNARISETCLILCLAATRSLQ